MNKSEHKIIFSWVFGSLTFLFLLLVFIFAPEELPAFKHKLLGIFAATLVAIFSFFFTGAISLSGEGKFPFFGRLSIRAGGSIAMLLFTLLWWFSDYSPIREEINTAVIPAFEAVDIHLGDNVYPLAWGYSHNPLHNNTYPQLDSGIIYLDKKSGNYVAGKDRPTKIGQTIVSQLQQRIGDTDLTAYEYVYCHQEQGEFPQELQNHINNKDQFRYVQIDPTTVLYTSTHTNGNFYERYAAVAVVDSVDFSIPLAKMNIEFVPDAIEKVEVFIECYHGGIRSGQAENFFCIINSQVFEIDTKSHNSREKEVISFQIDKNCLRYNQENILGFFVLPWTEDKPRALDSNNKPAHFRDVGIVNVYIKITAKNT